LLRRKSSAYALRNQIETLLIQLNKSLRNFILYLAPPTEWIEVKERYHYNNPV
jgi:hypothetical protein